MDETTKTIIENLRINMNIAFRTNNIRMYHYYRSIIGYTETSALINYLQELNDERITPVIMYLKSKKEYLEEHLIDLNAI